MSCNVAQMLEKQKMYDQIVSYRAIHPEISYRDIGKLFHVSGQRIHQILLLKGAVHKSALLTGVDVGSNIKVQQLKVPNS